MMRVNHLTDQWDESFDAGLSYFIEDNLTLGVTVSHFEGRYRLQYVHDSAGNISLESTTDRDTQLSFGLTYRLLGALDAPGVLSAPQHMR